MRLFIGMAVPPDLRERIQDAWTRVRTCPTNIRPIDPMNWHFTLAFLGDVNEANVMALDALISKAAERPPHGFFSFTGFETFPTKHPSYVVVRAMPEPAGEWVSFIERLRDLVSVAAPNVDRKPWVPHVSIARSKRGTLLPPNWRDEFGHPFDWQPTDMTLVQSRLQPQGSNYTDLHAYRILV
jgi:RNA 2',3'-cyclic 3'-phosphodiesterase